MFEMMHQHLFDVAHHSSNNDNHNNKSKNYTLDAVPKLGGGLLDDVSVVVDVVVGLLISNRIIIFHLKV